MGLVGALELAPSDNGRDRFEPVGVVGARLAAEMLQRGVIVRAIGDSVAFCPPMIIDEAGLAEMFAPLGDALDATELWARGEGILA